jgi:hypothetical protein
MQRAGMALLNGGTEMRQLLLAVAGTAMLAWTPAFGLDLDTGPDAYRRINGAEHRSYNPYAYNSYGSSSSYGSSGVSSTTMPGGRDSGDRPFRRLTMISPNDPAYSYFEPPHRGQPPVWELNGDYPGTYTAILGHDQGSGG